jgi:hypothetical protein
VLLLARCDHHENDSNRPKLYSVTWHFQDQGGEFRPAERTVYSYSGSKLVKTEQSWYDVQEEAYHLHSTSTFVYRLNRLDRIEQRLADNEREVVTHYEYKDGRVTKMTLEDNIRTEAHVQYLEGDTLKVLYQHSNGRSFTYKFSAAQNNIEYEQTRDDGQRLASEIYHEYDQGINPYSLLGYTDLFFTNYSANNKTKTASAYYAIGFPQSVPTSYTYEYNDQNLPVKQHITYKSYPTGDRTTYALVVFEYWD